MTTGEPALLAVDWGTSSVRAYWLDADGAVTDQSEGALGIQKVTNGDFAGALSRICAHRRADLPVIACGMIGSRQGWVEAPYRECPADFGAIAAALTQVPGTRVQIVPGLTCRDAQGVPDVMRGEETKIAGTLDEGLEGRAVVLMPGTHTKWALVSGGAVERFMSFMTGEIYAVLREHSILGRLAIDTNGMQNARDDLSFARGVEHSLRRDAAITHDVFSARTLALTNQLAPEAVGDYLSGLLIGAELAGARAWLAQCGAAAHPVAVLGDEALVSRYAAALRLAGIDANIGPETAAARGLWRIARHAHLV
jgi:2-dehydro-3-deoxygalactonokinase